MGALSSCPQGDASPCHPLLQNCTLRAWWEKLISRAAVTLQEFREGFFFQRGFLWAFFFLPALMLSFFPPSPALQKSENMKYWSYLQLFYSGAFDHSGSLFTVCSVSSNIQNYEKHIYLIRTNRGFFPKPSAAKLLTLSLLTVWSLAISSPTHTRNTTPTVFSKSCTAFLCAALAQSHFSLMFKPGMIDHTNHIVC